MNRHSVLLIEDNEDAREALALLLEHHGYFVRSAENGADALELCSRETPDLVITDLEMPILNGFDVLKTMRTIPVLTDVPVIVLSAHDDTDDRVAGLDLGADDFLAKPVHLDELLARMRRHLARSDRQREMARQSMVDALTGVLNRRGIENFFARELARSRPTGSSVAVILIDLNDFKAINDRWGHGVGDTALCAVSRGLQDALRANDRIGRMGGDEFAVVLPEVRADDCPQLAQRVRHISPIVIELAPGESIRVSLSLGLAVATDAETFAEVLVRADAAMYEDKRRQKRATQSLR